MDVHDDRDRRDADRLGALAQREADLVRMLTHCTPPVDQHRRELERVRSELADLRRASG
jgi:hypothetical protein